MTGLQSVFLQLRHRLMSVDHLMELVHGHLFCMLSWLPMSRVEQLRLLSKAEQAGLLSLAERNGLTLSFIERSGLLSKAESLGLLTAATDR